MNEYDDRRYEEEEAVCFCDIGEPTSDWLWDGDICDICGRVMDCVWDGDLWVCKAGCGGDQWIPKADNMAYLKVESIAVDR